MTTAITIRPMAERDVPDLLRLMRAIVSFEGGQDFRIDEADLLRRGFGARPEFGAFVADAGTRGTRGNGGPLRHSVHAHPATASDAEMALVDPDYRGARIGQRLMRRMAEHARATGHERFCWFVLTDNVVAQSFYRSLGATEDREWRRWIMPRNALNRLAEGAK